VEGEEGGGGRRRRWKEVEGGDGREREREGGVGRWTRRWAGRWDLNSVARKEDHLAFLLRSKALLSVS